MKLYPIYGERALFIPKEKTIVIADLHIGIEYEYSLKGINIPIQTKNLMNRCIDLIEKKRAEKVIILGDIKHIIEDVEYKEKERKEVRYFLKELSNHAEIWLIKGNHDGRIKSKHAKIFGGRGMKINGIALAHGHAWPSENIMDAEIFIMAHLHPHVRITTKIGYSYMEPCWIRGKFEKEKFKKRYENGNEDMQVIIMPAFNPLVGGLAMNKEEMKHGIASIIDIENSYVYLLNGINLGRIRNLR